MSDPSVAVCDAVLQRLNAIDVEVRCCTTFSRAILQGLAALSPSARDAMEAGLDEALLRVDVDDLENAAAANAVVNQVRAMLSAQSDQ